MPTLGNQMGSGTSALAAQATQGILNANSNNLTALGNSQATALALPSDFNVFTTVAASTGTILPASAGNVAQATDYYYVVNHGANALTVYPPVGGKISTGATNAGFSVPSGKTAEFLCLGSNNWAVSLSA